MLNSFHPYLHYFFLDILQVIVYLFVLFGFSVLLSVLSLKTLTAFFLPFSFANGVLEEKRLKFIRLLNMVKTFCVNLSPTALNLWKRTDTYWHVNDANAFTRWPGWICSVSSITLFGKSTMESLILVVKLYFAHSSQKKNKLVFVRLCEMHVARYM